MPESLKNKILNSRPADFDELALEIFEYQVVTNPIYRQYLKLLGIPTSSVREVSSIPFLPIQFFKQFKLKSGSWTEQRIFTSSSTSGQQASQHLLQSEDWYRQVARLGFSHFYGTIQQYCILGLLPAYLERTGSSLVFMVDDFMHQSGHPENGFFLYDTEQLVKVLEARLEDHHPTLLIGVSFALLDLAKDYPMDLSGIIIMETGGMKGRGKELTRQELHGRLRDAFGVAHIHSEYGMTELLSQAYSKGNGIFHPSPTMKVLARDITDPLSLVDHGRSGALNIIDLANLDTISFIATDDIGRVYPDNSFEVLGRMDASDIRGCNLMVADL